MTHPDPANTSAATQPPPAATALPPPDARLAGTLARLLSRATILACLVLAAGLVLRLVAAPADAARSLRTFSTVEERSFPALARGLADLDPHALMQGGVVLLILIPAARVALAGALLARRREGILAGIALFVLVVILAGFAGLAA